MESCEVGAMAKANSNSWDDNFGIENRYIKLIHSIDLETGDFFTEKFKMMILCIPGPIRCSRGRYSSLQQHHADSQVEMKRK
jgi:hypothetical protein